MPEDLPDGESPPPTRDHPPEPGPDKIFARPIIPLALTFAAGILVYDLFFMERAGLLVATGLAFFSLLPTLGGKPTAPVFRLLTPLLLFFLLGALAVSYYLCPRFPDDHIIHHVDEGWWKITGSVDSLPTMRGDRQIAIIRVQRLARGNQSQTACGRLRLTLYGERPPLPPGAVVCFASRIRSIHNFNNPGGFDYRRYMAARKVFGLAYTAADRLQILDPAPRTGFSAKINQMRQHIAGRIAAGSRGVPEQLLSALIVGRKKGLDPDVRTVFNRAGIGHLLAISGLHVGIVATVAFFLFSRLLSFWTFLLQRGWVRKAAALLTIAGVLTYGLLAGMSASTQRATIMVTVFLLALVADRTHDLFNTLALAGLIILAVFPPALFTVSFQLSFAAVFFILLGLSALGAPLQRLEPRLVRIAAGFVLVSALAIAGTLPLILHYFNQASCIGLLSNCLLIPLVGFVAVPLGLAGAFACLLDPLLSAWPAMFLFQASAAVLSPAYFLAGHLAALPFAAVTTVTPSIPEILCYYTILAAILVMFRARQWKPLPIAVMALALLVLAVDTGYWLRQRFFHDDLRLTVMDVGQGNAALLELPGGKCLLIDGGGFTGSSTFDVGKMIVAPFLWQKKIGAIDTIVLTHPDTDHLAGLCYIAEHFHVQTVWANGQPADTRHYADFLDILKNQNISRPPFADLPRRRRYGDVQMEILHPPDNFSAARSPNNNSLVLRVRMKDIAFLFCGDIMKAAEIDLVQTAGEKLDSDVLLVPHHGSKTSSTAAFIQHVTPDIAIVSAGWNNRYGYPHPEVVRRYRTADCKIFCTGRDGAVRLTTDGKTITVATFAADTDSRCY